MIHSSLYESLKINHDNGANRHIAEQGPMWAATVLVGFSMVLEVYVARCSRMFGECDRARCRARPYCL